MGIARRQKDLVVGNRDAANAAVARRLIGTHARFPDQVTRLSIERLHEVAGTGQINDAVVNDWGGLVRARVVDRPDPLQLQVLHVARRDLIQRAVAVAVVVAAEHQPVAGRRAFQHLGGDRDVVLHLAANGDAPIRCGAAATLASAGACPQHRQRRAGAVGARACSRCGCRRPRLFGQQCVHRRRNGGGQGLLAGWRAVGLQQVRRHLQRAPFTQRAWIGRRHRLNEVGEQFVHRSWPPFRSEVRPRESWRITRPAQVGRWHPAHCCAYAARPAWAWAGV